MAGQQEGAVEDVNLSEVAAGEGGTGALDGDETFSTPTTSGGTGKRKRMEPRDPNAPKRPCSGYIYFSTEMRPKLRQEKPNMSMSDRSKYIGTIWASLDPEKKKPYQEKAEADKQRYIREYLAYQETDLYKQFMRNKHPGLKKGKQPSRRQQQQEKQATPAAKASEKAPGKMPVSCQQQFIPGSNVPIFSDEFLQHNRDLESKLRKLRQTSANLEEENALLSRHVENMKAAVEKAQNEVKKQEERNENLQSHLGVLREVLAASFKDLPLPGSKETPTASTIDTYMSKLQTVITSEPKKHPVLVEKVSSIAKHLENVLREKLSQDALQGTVLEGEEGVVGEDDSMQQEGQDLGELEAGAMIT